VKAIETRYAGCRFRSRLEARWAVFFDAMEIEWQYEPQGFHLPSGPYLPDFYLPNTGKHATPDDEVVDATGTWLEVKGQRATHTERIKCEELGHAADEPVFLLQGDVPRQARWAIGIMLPAGTIKALTAPLWNPREGVWKEEQWVWGTRVDDSLTAARSARFEHGESPSW